MNINSSSGGHREDYRSDLVTFPSGWLYIVTVYSNCYKLYIVTVYSNCYNLCIVTVIVIEYTLYQEHCDILKTGSAALTFGS